MDEFRKTEWLELLEGIASVIVRKSGGKGEYLEKRQRLTSKSLAWVLVGRQSGFWWIWHPDQPKFWHRCVEEEK